MIELYLIRHGQSDMNMRPEFVCGRSNDSRLTAKGIMQSKYLGKRLKNEGVVFDQVYVSNAVRAEMTADIVMKTLGMPLEGKIYDCSLDEMTHGGWDGKPRTEVLTEEFEKNLKPG